MKVYIVFGDTPRSDGDNIAGIYIDHDAALSAMKKLEERNEDTIYSIEEHEAL